jgi:hypothetical protein
VMGGKITALNPLLGGSDSVPPSLVYSEPLPPNSLEALPSVHSEELPSADLLCRWCRHDSANSPATTAMTRRSGKVSKPIDRLESGAQEGCWVCKALLTAMTLWTKGNHKKIEWKWQPFVRFDKERFTLGGPAVWPRLQLFCPRGSPFRYIGCKEALINYK